MSTFDQSQKGLKAMLGTRENAAIGTVEGTVSLRIDQV